MERGRRRKGSVPQKGSGDCNHGNKSQGIEHESGPEKVDVQISVNKTNFAHKQKKSHENIKGRRYPLRSSQNGVRVLRSMSSKVNKAVRLTSTAQPITTDHRRKKKRRMKKAVKDEYSRIRKHVRYLLHRMAYEQNFVDAYASEGWKGQSLEKIRPEKELERAKSEIVKCKLRIRSQFQQLHSLMSNGKLDDSLFDSEGEIDSEDINCAKCGSKELRKNNDIILCDGICDRGFHQKCLTPPLLNEDIPPGDDAWFCPGCHCKLVCIDFINELHGSDLSIEDSWEKVFPEAAALAAGDKKYDDLGLPSDDSEDDDYVPGHPVDEGKVDGENSEESSAEDSSDESFTSEDPMVTTDGLSTKNLEYPSDDSDDYDFDPEKTSPKVQTQSDRTSSDESSFTSDTDDLNEFFGSKEALDSMVENNVDSLESNIRRSTRERDVKKSTENGQLLSLAEQDLDQENIPLISVKRNGKQLDCQNLYKKLWESFEENQHPSSEMKENLANKFGIAPKEVDKWFTNARHSFHVSTKETSRPVSITGKGIATAADSTPIGSFVELVKTAPKTTTITTADKCTPVSMKSITSDERVVCQNYSECDRKNLQNKASSSSSINVARIGEENKEAPIEQIDRQQLLLRELRKRKRCK